MLIMASSLTITLTFRWGRKGKNTLCRSLIFLFKKLGRIVQIKYSVIHMEL